MWCVFRSLSGVESYVWNLYNRGDYKWLPVRMSEAIQSAGISSGGADPVSEEFLEKTVSELANELIELKQELRNGLESIESKIAASPEPAE